MKADQIATGLNVSQPTVSRMIASLGNKIVRAGGSKNTLYAIPRKIRQLPEEIKVFRVNVHGDCFLACTLTGVSSGGYLMESKSVEWPLLKKGQLYFDSLPYFIQDVRPQGFMGDNFARKNSSLIGVPEESSMWSDDDALVAMGMMGSDLPGNLIIGERAYREFMDQKEHLSVVGEHEIGIRYFELANRAENGDGDTSLVAGKFPKFTTVRRRHSMDDHVLVKFSGTGKSAAETRWADLLRCEAIASDMIRDYLGVESAENRVFSYDGRTFLESTRFDRHDTEGRRSLCSLASIDAEFLGMGDPHWDEAADKLLKLRIITRETADSMRALWYFGKLIGNTDMHAGNLSFEAGDQGKLFLTPAYDMLPMRYAPTSTGEVAPSGDIKVFTPLPGSEMHYLDALTAACRFWEVVIKDPDISQEFIEIAKNWLHALDNAPIPSGKRKP